MDKRPIGVFDSGVGGLTAVKELRKILPGEEIVYFGDTARVPYGSRSAQTIKKYATQAIRFLASFDVKAILAACGTVSCNFTQEDYDALGLDIPYVTVVQPASDEAVRTTENNKIGLIATTASVASGVYLDAIHTNCPDCQVVGVACPLLVQVVEAGLTDEKHPVTKATLEMYLEDIKSAKVDTLILGCTHFPLLKKGIGKIVGDNVTLIDSGAAAARRVKTILDHRDAFSGENTAVVNYYVTDTIERFSSVAEVFLTEDISGNVQRVDVETIDCAK